MTAMAAPVLGDAAPALASTGPQTVVSLTFDNGAISQYTLGYQKALAPNGVKATFYVNAGVIGGANHMSWSQLSALQSAGQSIGGKTVDGTNLTTLSSAQQVAEICNDRQALISHGLTPAGFAYPYGAFTAILESKVQGCGYDNARAAGGLSPAGPSYAETQPPKNGSMAVRAYAPTGQITLANLEALVTGADSHGGGWVPVVIQKVCSQSLDPDHYANCTSSSGWIELADLNIFLSWIHNAGHVNGAPTGTTSQVNPTGTTSQVNPPAVVIPPGPRLQSLRLAPGAFAAATSRATIARAPGIGTTISYRDTLPARTTFRVLRCAGKRGRCTRLVLVGSFTHRDRMGANRLHFAGRLAGHALAPGRYVLSAIATLGGQRSRAVSATFQILVRPANRQRS